MFCLQPKAHAEPSSWIGEERGGGRGRAHWWGPFPSHIPACIRPTTPCRWIIQNKGFPLSKFSEGPLEFFIFAVTILVGGGGAPGPVPV